MISGALKGKDRLISDKKVVLNLRIFDFFLGRGGQSLDLETISLCAARRDEAREQSTPGVEARGESWDADDSRGHRAFLWTTNGPIAQGRIMDPKARGALIIGASASQRSNLRSGKG